jgi:hypothetical protein
MLTGILATGMLCFSDNARAGTMDFPGGFLLRSSLEEAKQHAISRGWQLAPLPRELPGQWEVKGQRIGLFICENTISRISQSASGDLDEFARFIFDLQLKRGKPDLQIVNFMSGVTEFSNVDARFDEVEGVGISVQLSSIAGALAMSRSYWSRNSCSAP